MIKEKKELVRNHSDYLPLLQGLTEKGFKPIGEFRHKDFVFESFLNTDKIVWIQKDVNGKTILIYQQINKTRVIDILNELETGVKEKTLKPRTNKITRLIDWLGKVEKVFYGR